MSSSKNRLGLTSLAVAVIAFALKYLAWRVSGSDALLSDAMETVINIAAAIGALWALSFADRPPDENHTYGHGKAEYLSAVMESVLVILTAIGIADIAWRAWHDPHPLRAPWLGIALNAAAGG